MNHSGRSGLTLLAISIVAVLVLLGMYQVDRQWSKLRQMEGLMQEQLEELRRMRSATRELSARLKSGGAEIATSESTPISLPPAFERAAAAAAQPDFARGDWLVRAFGNNLKTITPLVSTDVYAREIEGYVLETLAQRDPITLDWIGLIARDWSISEDGITFTFNLREDVHFSDGEPLTAEDVVFSFEFLMDERIAAPRLRAYYSKIESVIAEAPYRVSFRFAEPYFNSLALAGGLSIMPKHFYEPFLEDPEAYNQSKGRLLGSGPYRLADPLGWTPDQGFIELERNQRYWGAIEPTFDRLVWKVIENDNARLTSFRNGEIDAYSARPLDYRKLVDDEQLKARARHLEYMSPTAGYSYIAWNQERNEQPTRLADPRVREALTLLTDRERIAEEIMLGYAEVAVSPFSPRSKQHDPDLTPRRYDLVRAQALLSEAGYSDRDGDGVLESREGEPFKIELIFFQDSDDTRRIALFLKDSYARAGILLEPKPSEWSVMLDLMDRKDFEAIVLGWSGVVESDLYQIFHCSQAIPGGDNYIGYCNPELDRLIEQARATVDEAARMPLWREAERLIYNDLPYTFLMRRKSLVFVDRRMKNLEVTRLGFNINFTPVEWYVPSALQKYER